jgi:four helix bundle protein
MTSNSYKNLIVWQKSYSVCLLVYTLTNNFPKNEVFGLVSQMRRASVSIPSNIAEGNMRFTPKEHAQFIRIAYGSAAELETQLMLSKDLKFISETEYTQIIELLTEVMKMLSVLLVRFTKI